LLADADKLAGEDAGFGGGLFGLVRVSLGTFGRLEDEGFGLLLDGLELEDVPVELAGVVPDQLVAFAELVFSSQRWCLCQGVWNGRTCAAGSGFQKMDRIDSMARGLCGRLTPSRGVLAEFMLQSAADTAVGADVGG
jgi:hypothetical protein